MQSTTFSLLGGGGTAESFGLDGKSSDTFSAPLQDGAVASGAAVDKVVMAVPAPAANQAPVIDLNGAATGKNIGIGYTIGSAEIAIATAATVTDADSTNFNGGTLTIAITGNGASGDVLHLLNQGTAAGQVGVSGSNVTYGGTVIGTLTGNLSSSIQIAFNASSSPAAAQAVAEDIYFSNSGSLTSYKTVTYTMTDGAGGSDSATATIYPHHAIDPNDIVVYRVGDGSTALTGAAAAAFLDEYTTAGAFVQTIALPQADSGANQTLTAPGATATNTGGVLGRSADFRYLLLSGYDAAPGTASVSTTTAAAVNRVVGLVDAAGTVDTATALNSAFSGNPIRGVASVDGSNLYVAGGGTSGGIQYVALHGAAGTQIATGDIISVTIDEGQLYADTTSAITRVGGGLPTTSTGLASLGVALSGAHEYVLLDRDSSVAGVDTLYVAQDNALLKFGLVGGAWTAEGSIATGLAGLDAKLSSSGVTFYATTASTSSNPGGNAIVTFTDTAAYNATISATSVTVLATAAANTGFRGLSFAPSIPTVSIISAPQRSALSSHTTGQSGGTFTFDIYRESTTIGSTVQYAFSSNLGDWSFSNPSGTATFAANSLRTTITTSVMFTASGGGANDFGKLTLSGGSSQIISLAAQNYPFIDLNGAATGTGTTLAYTVGGVATAIAPATTVADQGSGYNEKTLTVAFTTNGTATDQLTIQNQGTGVGQIGVSGSTVSYSGTTIGTFSGGANGASLVIAFNTSTATPAAAQALAEQILFSNTSSSPSTAARTVTFSLQDTGGTANSRVDTGTATATVNVTAADAPPVAVADSGSTPENAVLNLAVTANDTDSDGGPKAVASVNGTMLSAGSSVTLASGAIVTLNADGTLTYDPNHKFDYLVSAATASATGALDGSAGDSFGYALNGGSTTTVTVTITGVDGNGSELRGDGGNNAIGGTPQADFFNLSQGGTDTASGLGGDDAFYMGAALSSGDSIDGGSGSDQVAVQGNYAGYTLGAGNLVNIETLAILSGTDTRFGDSGGHSYSYNLTAVDANVAAGQQLIVQANMLQAGENLTFNGSAETDGSFIFYAGQGTDSLTGGQQSDAFFFGEGRFNAADHVDGQGGADDQLGIRGDYSTQLVFGATTMVNIETIALLSAADTRYASGGTAYNYNLKFDDANVAAGQQLTVTGNTLLSTESMTVDGSAETNGSFRFIGGAGNDTFIGGAGNDLFYGRGGHDVMTGGGGNDTFYFYATSESTTNPATMDQITDFTTGDKIDLSTIDANTAVAGNQAFTFLGTDVAFTHHAGELHVVSNGTNGWIVEVDTDGDGNADMGIAVTTPGGHTWVAGDFAL